jgi:hypothetical protein
VININGWTIKDAGTDNHTISNVDLSVPILPGDFFVFARNADSTLNGGVVANYEYSNFLLSNSDDEIILTDQTGAIVDEVHYTNSWDFGNGASMEIHDLNSNNNESENWFEATLSYGNSDFGTPGTFYDGSLSTKNGLFIPTQFELLPPYPNPFNPSTSIRFEIKDEIKDAVSLYVYDITGRIVETFLNGEIVHSGSYEFLWYAQNQASGIYFIQLSDGSRTFTQKAILIK